MADKDETGDVLPEIDRNSPEFIKKIFLYIKSIWTILASVLAILVVINKIGPEISEGTPVHSVFEWLFDLPSIFRQAQGRAELPAQLSGRSEVQTGGYLYYEVSYSGQPTSDGRMMPLSGPMPAFDNIKQGDEFKTIDQIRLRAQPTSNSQLLNILNANVCVKVSSGGSVRLNVSNAASGGWLPVVIIPCKN